MRLIKLIVIYFILVSITSVPLTSQENQILEFNNKPVADVLMALADLSGKNIIPDKSVTGICSYFFNTDNIEIALTLFLKSQNLYITKLDTAFSVSKVYTKLSADSNITLTTKNTDIKLVLDKLITETGVTILYDTLPLGDISLNIKDLKLNVILEIIMKKYPEYKVEKNNDYYYIKKEQNITNSSLNETIKTKGIKVNEKGLYSINLKKVRSSSVLLELFEKHGAEYSVQGRNDNIINRLDYKDKTFEQILNLILEAGGSDYVLSNNIYYIFDINKTEVANRHIVTKVIKLENIEAKDLLKLMPGSFISNNALKIDESTNSVIVYGTNIKINPIINFIKLVDKDKKQKPYWIKMDFVSSDLFKNILYKHYPREAIINVDKNSFLILLTKEEQLKVLELKKIIDIPPKSFKIVLKYIKSEQLLENIPKSVTKDQIIVTPNPSVIFFYGQKEGYIAFSRELIQIDKPVPQIKYKVLVLQNTVGNNLNFGIETKAHSENNGDITLPDGEWRSFSGALGSLLGLNFNVLSAFGPLFSFQLNAAIKDNKSKILVDTTLQGLSGKKVSFRNTTTSRFYQTTTDVDGNTEQTGATQEVSWGILLDIEGWISGDGMITANIQSTISDETKLSGDSSGIPSTSEKIVNTEIRTPEGIPVVIGGLLSSKKEVVTEKVPLLGDIPLLGLLFRKHVERETKSEFVIYLLPYIQNYQEENTAYKLKNSYLEYRNR